MASLWSPRALRPYLSAEPILGGVVGSDFWPPESISPAIAVRQTYKTVNSRVQRGVNVLAGDSILVGFYQDGALVPCSISDDAAGGTNTYEEVGEGIYVTGGSGCGIRTFKATAKASEKLTITETGGSGYPIIFVHVVEGPSKVGGVVTKADTSASLSHTSAELTVPEQDAYLFCLWGEAGGAYTMAENGAGFRKREDDHGTATHDRIATAPGTFQDVVTSSGNVHYASILLALVLASTAINGTGSGTQALQTSSGTGSATYTGTGAVTQRTQSAAGTGSATYSGSGASTQSLQPGAGTGTNTVPGVNGTGSGTQALQSGGGTGTATFAGIGAGVQRVQSSAGTGTQTLGGSGGGVQVRQVGTGQGSASLAGTGAGLQAIQIGTGQGVLTLNGSGAGVQVLQSCDGVGTVATFQPSTLDLGFFLALPPITNTFTLPPVDALVVLPAINQTITLPPVDSTLTLPALKIEVTA